jgi:hypothetical protein
MSAEALTMYVVTFADGTNEVLAAPSALEAAQTAKRQRGGKGRVLRALGQPAELAAPDAARRGLAHLRGGPKEAAPTA